MNQSSSLRRYLPWVLVLLAVAMPYFSGGRDPIATLLVAALSSLMVFLLLTAGSKLRGSPILVAWGAVVAAAALSSFVAPAAAPAIAKLTLYAAYGLLLWVCVQLDPAELKTARTGAVIAGAGILLFGAYTYWGPGSGVFSFSSTFYNPNAFAGYLVLLIGLAAGGALGQGAAVSRALFAVIGAASLVAIWITGSRAALVGVAAAALILSLALIRRRRGTRWTRKHVVIGFAVLIAAIAIPVAAIAANALSTQDLVAQALKNEPRIEYWSGAMQIGAHNPVAGEGTATFARAFPEVQQSILGFSRDAHSRLFEAFAEGGLLGVSAFIFFALTALWTCWKAVICSKDEDLGIAVSSLAATAAFLVHGAIDFQWMFPANLFLFFLALGLSARLLSREIDAKVPVRLGVTVAAFAALFAGLLQYVSQSQVESALLAAAALDPKGAESSLKVAAQTNPWAADPHHYLGVHYLYAAKDAKSGKRMALLDRARAEVEKANALDPGSAIFLSSLADIDREKAAGSTGDDAKKYFVDVRKDLEEAYRLDPWNRPEVPLHLADLLDQQGDKEKARRLLTGLVERYPVDKLEVMKAWFAAYMTKQEMYAKTEGNARLREQFSTYFNTADSIAGAHYRLANYAALEQDLVSAQDHAEIAAKLSLGDEAVLKLKERIKKRLGGS